MHQRLPADLYDRDDLLAANMGQPAVGGGYHGTEAEMSAAEQSGIDLLDDVFGSGEAEDAGTAQTTTAARGHPSDMTRLQQEHSTAGYRDGVTAGKEASSQGGFDEGYSLGAALGLAAGELLGLLEGMAGGVVGAVGADDAVEDECVRLLARARHELKLQSIYGPAYFSPDGTWTFALAAEEATVFDVARAHPLIRRWRQLVEAQAEQLDVVMGDDDAAVKAALGLGDADSDSGNEEDEGATATEKATAATAVSSRNVPASNSSLDW